MQRIEPTLIIHERRGIWAAKIRQIDESIPIVETRIWDNHLRELRFRRHSISMIDASDDLQKCASRAAQLHCDFCDSRLIVVGDLSLEQHAWAFMELGACFVAFNYTRLRIAANLINRQLGNAPRPKLTFLENIQRRLPWRRV